MWRLKYYIHVRVSKIDVRLMCRFNNLEARLSEALEINRLCRIKEARI